MSERNLAWHPIRKILNELGWGYQRIEDRSSMGVPDLNFITPEHYEIWAELKCVPEQTGKNIYLGLRPEQRIWLYEGEQAGRFCVLVARVGPWWYAWVDAGSWQRATVTSDWGELAGRALGIWAKPLHLVMGLRRWSQARVVELAKAGRVGNPPWMVV